MVNVMDWSLAGYLINCKQNGVPPLPFELFAKAVVRPMWAMTLRRLLFVFLLPSPPSMTSLSTPLCNDNSKQVNRPTYVFKSNCKCLPSTANNGTIEFIWCAPHPSCMDTIAVFTWRMKWKTMGRKGNSLFLKEYDGNPLFSSICLSKGNKGKCGCVCLACCILKSAKFHCNKFSNKANWLWLKSNFSSSGTVSSKVTCFKVLGLCSCTPPSVQYSTIRSTCSVVLKTWGTMDKINTKSFSCNRRARLDHVVLCRRDGSE